MSHSLVGAPKVHCTPLFYPHEPSHADTVAHDRNTKGRYFVVAKGRGPGVYTYFRDANDQTDNHPDARQKSCKTWEGPAGPDLPDGFDAPTAVFRPPPPVPARSRLAPSTSTSTPSATSQLPPPLTPTQAPPRVDSTAPQVNLDTRLRVTPYTRVELTSRRPQLEAMASQQPSASQHSSAAAPSPIMPSAPFAHPHPSPFAHPSPSRPTSAASTTSWSIASSQLSDDSDMTDTDATDTDDDADDAESSAGTIGGGGSVAAEGAPVGDAPEDRDIYWAVEGVDQFFPTAEQAKRSRHLSSIQHPLLMRSHDLEKLARFGARGA
ncbi:hypothetical protein C8R43DRAFT_1136870 [Mycena crocata]|nr:hypothetical protein C8R43DRAFT_1136870 [Mycena crocata]